MTFVEQIPDMQRVASRWVREHEAVNVFGARVVSKPPEQRGTCWVQVTQLGARDTVAYAEHLIDFHLQFDCYAGSTGGLPEAMSLGRAVRQALAEVAGQNYLGVVFARVELSGPILQPDVTFEPPRERTIIDADILAHIAAELSPS